MWKFNFNKEHNTTLSPQLENIKKKTFDITTKTTTSKKQSATPSVLKKSSPRVANHGALNDRFCMGERRTLLRWFQRRFQLAQNGVYGETGACNAAKALKLNVSSTDIKFVRRRSNLFVPDIDKATVKKSIPCGCAYTKDCMLQQPGVSTCILCQCA